MKSVTAFFLLFALTGAGPIFADTTNEDVLEGYRAVSTSLAADRYSETRDTALKLVPVLEAWLKEHPGTDPQAPFVAKMVVGAKQLGETSEELALRLRFSAFSEGAVGFLKRDPVQARWQLFFCHMVEEGFTYWAQAKSEKMANPYMGLKMLQCGVKKSWWVIP